MCGRYGLYDLPEADRIKENTGYHFKPNYNVAPTQQMPIIVEDTGVKLLVPMKWGIHRQIGKDLEKDIINTRSDKAFGRFWGKTVRTQRCLIPANGFYEWKTIGKQKFPYWIHLKKQPQFFFAGIYANSSGEGRTFSIMTTTPNKEMSDIHNRMPVILTKDRELEWLKNEDEDVLEELLQPLPDNSLELYQVSRDVNSPKNNTKHLLEPV